MNRLQIRRLRHGALLVEAAFVYPVAFLFLLGLCIGGMGIFLYQEVAHLARETTRWASVHGGQYALDTGNSAATATTVYSNVIQPNAVGFDLSRLSYTVNWDDTGKMPTYYDYNAKQWKTNNVRVTVSYEWVPEFIITGSITLTSTAEMPVYY
jgi:hypothetical protein